MIPRFEPIAIVGRGCIVPGCDTPEALWRTVQEGLCHITDPPAGDWRVDMDRVVSTEPGQYRPDHTWSVRGGYVDGLSVQLDASADVEPELFARLDPVFRWSLHAAGQALAGVKRVAAERGGLILGNLSYPTRALGRLVERHWTERALGAAVGPHVHPLNRFMSGSPAMLTARAFGLEGGSLALDAACASGLYAIKIACDRLQDRRADLMLAGSVNAADQLFLHVGFSALNAMSSSGRSRPFHREADGLVPAEGSAFVALKRLSDAQAAGDRIHGVIRGMGLSNDGRSGGFLAPAREGQIRAMRAALDHSGLTARRVQYIECHATGTPVGDATEISAIHGVYGDSPIALGSLKANLGHLITASGIAGLIKTLSAMEHGRLPGTPGARPLSDAFGPTAFTASETDAPWEAPDGQRTAAVSGFGFGGNNAHVLVQQQPEADSKPARRKTKPVEGPQIAIVGLGLRTHLDPDAAAFGRRLLGGQGAEAGFDPDMLGLGARQLAFPPAELKKALGQQLVLIELARHALQDIAAPDPARTGVFIGMQTDTRVGRHGVRIRWPELMREAGVDAPPAWSERIADVASEPLDSATVIGKMPNIPANRLSNQMDLKGPSFAVSREELSGDAALDLAMTALRRGEIDAALVGAVDFCLEPTHQAAGRALLGEAGERPGDAAVLLALKTLDRARADGDRIIGLITEGEGMADAQLSNTAGESPLFHGLGHAHAASGLIHVAFGLQMLAARSRIDAAGRVQPLLAKQGPVRVTIRNGSFQGEQADWRLEAAPSMSALHVQVPLRMRRYAAPDRERLLTALRLDEAGGEGDCRLALVGEAEEMSLLRERALRGLLSQPDREAWSIDGISFRAKPLAGELAFAFTGAASAYAGMGRGLLLAMPGLADSLNARLPGATLAADWIYAAEDPRAGQPFHQLAGSSFLCQLHATLSLEVLGLRPTAALGLSSGETNAMFAFGLWNDINGLLTDVQASALYSSALAGDFDAVRAHWGLAPGEPVNWDNLRVRAPVGAVEAAVAAHPRVYLTIINSPLDCVIGGDAQACHAVVAALGDPPALPLGHDLAVHCAAVSPFEDAWRTAHTRPTAAPPPGVRFYSNALGGVFSPDEASVAEALTGQALRTVDFPMIVEQAWADGARIFLEHGPRGSLSTAIDEILGERAHLAVALDRFGIPAQVQAWRAAAQLWCAGVGVDLDALETQSAPTPSPHAPAPPLVSFRLKPEGGDMPPLPTRPSSGAALARTAASVPRSLPRAPELAPLASAFTRPPAEPVKVLAPAATVTPAPIAQPLVSQTSVPAMAASVMTVQPAAQPMVGLEAMLVAAHQRMAVAHAVYMRAQTEAMQAYIDTLGRLQTALSVGPTALPPPSEPWPAPAAPAVMSIAAPPPTPPSPPIIAPPRQEPASKSVPAAVFSPAPAAVRILPGPKFDRAQLEILAGGKISSVFGPRFAGQDGYDVQVRMPEPPLLLCDRVLGIEGEPHSMGRGVMWTATDVRADSWYLHHGRMPPGVFIECGQADLLLISWLGVDGLNKGERAYRLLGCELTFEGELPKPGDTLEYEIHIDGHANQGDVRLFFFHYDCHIGGQRRISVRNGQAGFFTPEELDDSNGVIWSADTAAYSASGRVDPAPLPTARTNFTEDQVQAYLDGDLHGCFGPGFDWADTHTRTPSTPADHRNFLGEVTKLDFAGGPAGRGYMRVEKAVRGDEWFFDGHFKNDPCMPGTLMADACLQGMAFYMAATGRTLKRDGWRFQPVRGEPYTFLCRGQVTPRSKRIVYETFIDEILDGEMPILRAHVLCTVDGRKAFLCERLALQIVPDWPLSGMPEVLAAAERTDERPLAKIGEFPLDYRSLINCALGQPTHAFGPRFDRYDGAGRSPRLPAPPYHFMTRITALEGEMASMKAGNRVTALYDVPADAWYFGENGAPTMPNCVLMEVALQPCGWLASYTLHREPGAPELLFRNLDGDALQYREVRPGDGAITTEVQMTSLDQVGDLIIEKFSVRCTIDGQPLLDVETVFGFFPPEAMANQKGFGPEVEDLSRPAATAIDLAMRPPALFGRSARLPDSKLLMIDRIVGYWPQGGSKGLGLIRAEKDVVVGDWFFKAHFFQDPVQPGSLGVEAMLQAMQSLMLLEGMDEGMTAPRFEPLALGERALWHYRGQVTPEKKMVAVEFELHERGRDAGGPFVVGRAVLTVDGLQIYQAPRLGMRLVEGAASNPPRELNAVDWRLDSDGETAWVKDHRPTYTIPTLPLTYELEMMAAAAAPLFPGQAITGIGQAEARKWVAFNDPVVRGATKAKLAGPGVAQVELELEKDGAFVKAATGVVLFGALGRADGIEPLEPLRDAVPVENAYLSGALFHGPALRLMRNLIRGSNGASAMVDADASGLPVGRLHPGLLDAALHCIPHDDPRLWAPGLPPGLAAYPSRIEGLRFFADPALGGVIEVQARARGLEGPRLMRTHVRLSRDGVVIAMFDLVEALMPKGPLGAALGPARRAFLAERRFTPSVALAEVGETTTRLARETCLESDWLPGTLAAIYGLRAGEDMAGGIALRDHAAAALRLHPAAVSMGADGACLNLPLNPWRLAVSERESTVEVSSPAPGPLDWTGLREDWSDRLGAPPSFVLDLGIALIQRFVRRVVLTDPAGFKALAGRPVLYLANHQTGVESFLFLSIVAAMARLPAGAIAKKEHSESWVGLIHRMAEAAMGEANPLKLWLFDRAQPADLLRLLGDYADDLAVRPSSLLVHTDGTRSTKAGAPVGSVSSVLIDLALSHDLPIVPVRFAGGLPLAEASARLEFPSGAGQQDYLFGAAIQPSALRALPFAERGAYVLERLNALGPRGEDDTPLPPDPAFAAAVSAGRAAGLVEIQAHLRAALAGFPSLGEQTLRLLRDPAADPSAVVVHAARVLIGGALQGAAP
jgi:acyl transferase domain-containing protein/3-hydroxymyristoyl/3-hydroxydecanoyl-(acyl carrier protein) dehydratase/1-acyl-sn-glycerol-3-phosphate acyltransferase